MYYIGRYNSKNITLAESVIYCDDRIYYLISYFNEILTTIVTSQQL